MREWPDNWKGLGLVAIGMQRQGYKLHLTTVEGTTWRATFSGPPEIGAQGFGTGQSPWRAVQTAAWDALGAKSGEQEGAAPAEDIDLP